MKLKNNIDKLGTIGMFFTALLSPCCFPLFAFVASALGLGSFELFGGWTMWIFQGMVLLSLVGFFLSYRLHRCLYPLLIAIPSTIIIFYSYYFCNNDYQSYFLYTGMFGLLIATIVNYHRNKLHYGCNTCTMYNGKSVELKSKITCPHCGHKKEEMMPTVLIHWLLDICLASLFAIKKAFCFCPNKIKVSKVIARFLSLEP